MENLGKANVQVQISDGLIGINKEPTKYNFDISAWNWQAITSSGAFYPLLTDHVADDNEGFAALFPSRRKFYVDNYLMNSDEGAAAIAAAGSNEIPPSIEFKPKDIDANTPTVSNIVLYSDEARGIEPFDTYTLLQPDEYANADLDDYKGPLWRQALVSKINPPNDAATIVDWYQNVQLELPSGLPSVPEQKTLHYLNQSVVRDGLYWGLESESFLSTNMPLWVNLRIARQPPSAARSTFFVISLGIDSNDQAYDILFEFNAKTSIIDYYRGRDAVSESGETPYWRKEFDTDISKMLDSQEEIEIGIMACAGRLVIWANQVSMVYTRMDRDADAGDDSGTLLEAQIASGKMQVWGSNVQATINVCPMVFAPLSVMALPLPSIVEDSETATSVTYKGVDNNGNFGGAVCILPSQPDASETLYGVDCDQFSGEGGSASPSGFGVQGYGYIYFDKWSTTAVTTLPEADFYYLAMVPENLTIGSVTLPYARSPYFFRIKGGAQITSTASGGGDDVSEDVISATENASAPDYFHALTTANVTLYNEGGRYDDLRDKQHGITIKWGWGSALVETFTGLIVSATTNETAGMETITLQCEDYMHVLKNTPIVNSPFYDGMVAYYALQDLAERGGILNFTKDWSNEDDYFLPSGYSFSKPLLRYPSTQKIFECMIDILKRFEAFMYFDSNGYLHINKLPGGLFSEQGGVSISAEFARDPDGSVTSVILDEKAIDYWFGDTFNRINILTVNRDTRAAVLYTHSATTDNVAYRHMYMVDQPAYGDIEVARTYADRLGDRIFWPIRKSAFKTVGDSSGGISNIFDFVKVDGDEFRLMGLQRTYSADENSFTNEYNVEWLGGQ